MKNPMVGHSWKNAAKKLVCGVSAMGLAAAMVPAAAMAGDTTSTYYALPTANQVKSFDHTEAGKGGNYTYHYVTIGSSATDRVAPMMQTYYETLGLNYINAYSGPGSIYNSADGAQTPDPELGLNTNYTGGSVGSLTSRNSTLAIMGSDNNESPDEYIWNYCCWANGATVAADSRALDRGNRGTGAVSLTIGGTEYADFPREVYTECDIINQESSTGNYQGTTWLDWIDLENQRENRPAGKDAVYDPTFLKYGVSGTGGAGLVKTLHTLADQVDSVIAKHVDANGNYTLQSRYGGNRADGTGASIDIFEDIVQGTQYYTMSKIEDGTVDKAVVAVLVGYDPKTGNYAVRKFNTDKDPDGNQYGGRVANYCASIASSITELGLEEAQQPTNETEAPYIAWYTPEQIVANADACFTCDAYSSNNVSTYLATATNGRCYTVYYPASVSEPEEDYTFGLNKARNEAVAAGKHAANFCFSYPADMFGNFYAQGVENGMLAVITSAFTYPDLFGSQGLTDMLGYWAKNVWHIKQSSLQSIVEGTCSGMSLTGIEIGKVSSDYTTNAEKYFKAGNEFYIAHQTELDQVNGGNLKTFNLDGLMKRTGVSTANTGSALKVVNKTALSPAERNAVAEDASQTIKLTSASKSFKVKALKKAKKTFTVKVSGAKTALTVTPNAKAKKAKITAKASGKTAVKVTVPKGTKKGTYKISVKAKKATGYKASAAKTITVKVS